MKSFIKFFLDKSQFTFIIILGILALGWNTLNNIPQSEDPQIDYNFYSIVVVMPGALPAEMQDRVVKPIEDRFNELEDVIEIKAKSWSNIAVVIIKYTYESDRKAKYQEIIREMGALRTEKLPENVHSISIDPIKSSDVNIFQLTLQSDEAKYDVLEKYAVELKDALKMIDGLKNVKTHGYPEQEVRVELDIEKITKYKIPIYSILNALKRESFNVPAGNVVSGNSTFSVKTGNKYVTAEEIANTIVFELNRQSIRLRDIAFVKKAYEEEKHFVRLNGIQSVLVTSSLKDGYNISSVAEKARSVLKDFEKTLPDNIYLVSNFDQAVSVKKRMSQLGIDFLLAILLVLITLLPLGFRSTLVVMISIPLSISIALVCMSLFGYNLNQLSIVGLIIALGILVDDSIVVNENIERALRSGLPLKKAILESTSQIAYAVIGVTVTLVIAFVPLLLMPDVTGEFIRSLPIAVVLSVSASLFVSLALVPSLSGIILKEKTNPEGNYFLRFLKKCIDATYSKLIRKSLKHPVWATVIVVIISLAGLSVLPFMGFTLFPKTDKPQFYIEIETAPNSSLQYTNIKTKEVEAVLTMIPSIDYFTANVGKGNPPVYYNITPHEEANNYAEIFVQCHDEISIEEKTRLIDYLRTRFNDVIDVKIRVNEYEQGPPLEAPVAIRLFGENIDTLQKYSVQIEDIIKSVEGTTYVQNPILISKTGLKIILNQEKASLFGINSFDVDNAIRMAIAGVDAGEIELKHAEDKSSIRVTLPRNKNQKMDIFDKIYILSRTGASIPLKAIADVVFEKTPGTLTRLNKEQYTTITASAHVGYLYGDLNNRVIDKLEPIQLPEGYRWEAAGEKENQDQSFAGFGTILIISGIAFLSALILEFKSFKSILIVLSVIPLGAMGGILALYISGNPLSFVSMVGFIALIGIEIKNSILLVDYTNYLRKEENMSINDAVAKAGEVRFIPIFLTTMTAVAGMIPLIVQHSPLYSPLAMVIAGGLISSLLLSRILTPVLYKLLPPKIEE